VLKKNVGGEAGQNDICFGGGKMVLEITEKYTGISYLFS
jgi:hypothetical protein